MVGKALKGLLCAVVGFAAVAVTSPAHADSGAPLNCTELAPGGGGTGQAQFNKVPGPGDKWAWHFRGIASCGSEATSGSYEATFEGVGTSDGLGQCSPTGTVNNLSIAVDITMFSTQFGTVRNLHETWGASTTTFPETTPFVVSQGANTIGVGTLFAHIFDHCPPGGTQTTWFQWIQEF